MKMVFDYLLHGIAFILIAQKVQTSTSPKYVWPLGNSTVYKEVMAGRDAHLPVSHQCFVFSDGYPGLPYRALTLTGEDNSFVDFYLNGKVEFTDFTLSLYIYPTGEPEGIILNYLCETGNVIKLAVLQGLLFVSFWDEYGVSVGATAVPELLVADSWNHLVVSREFDTGRIMVYHNGELVDDIDDDFPNKIPLPIKGSLRLGSSQKDKEDPKFKGRFACFQFYTSTLNDDDVRLSQEFCMPDKWKIVPEMNLETKTIDGYEKECVTDYIAPREEGDVELKDCDIIDMGCLYSGVNWEWVLRKYKWTASTRASAYFHLINRDQIPEQKDGIILGDVTATDKKTCSRLCLRVKGCKAFSSDVLTANTTHCVMYNRVAEANLPEPGSVYFSLV